MNEQALIDELRKPEYAGLTDQQAADAVNAKTVQQSAPVAAQHRERDEHLRRIGDARAVGPVAHCPGIGHQVVEGLPEQAVH